MMIVALDKKLKEIDIQRLSKETIKPTDMITAILDMVVKTTYIIFEFRIFFLGYFLNSD